MNEKELIAKFKALLDGSLDAARSARMEDDRRRLLSTVGQDIAKMLAPFLLEVAKSSKANKKELKEAMQELLGTVSAREMAVDTKPITDAIERAMSNVKLPEAKVSVFPKFDLSTLEFPKEQSIGGWVELMQSGKKVSYQNPIPVQLWDNNGNPVDLFKGLTQIMQGRGSGGATGGKADYLTIKGFSQSAFAEIMNPDGRLKVELPSGASGLTDAELRASSVPVAQASGAMWSTQVFDVFQTTVASSVINPDNRVRVELPAGTTGLTDVELRATAVPVSQVSGANWSVSASFETTSAVWNADNRLRVSVETGGSGLTDAELRAAHLDVLQMSGAVESTNIQQVNGSPVVVGTGYKDNALRVVEATDSVVSTNLNTVNGSPVVVGTGYQDNALRTVEATDSVVSTNLMQTRGSATVVGTGYQDNALRVVHATDAVISVNLVSSITQTTTVSGSISSTVATGPTVADAADDGSAPVQTGGIARTANPTAVAANDVVKATFDDLGRQIIRPIQVRDLTLTAYVSVANGTETTLRAAVAGAFLDLMMITATNNSSVATQLDIRATTGGNIIHTMYLPAQSGPIGWAPPVPWPQDNQGNNWTIDMPDQTGTTVYVSALFSQEV